MKKLKIALTILTKGEFNEYEKVFGKGCFDPEYCIPYKSGKIIKKDKA